MNGSLLSFPNGAFRLDADEQQNSCCCKKTLCKCSLRIKLCFLECRSLNRTHEGAKSSSAFSYPLNPFLLATALTNEISSFL